MVQKRVDDAMDDQIVARYRSGQTGPDVARSLGLGTTTVYRALARRGIRAADEGRPGDRSHSNRKLSDDAEREIGQSYLAGASRTVLATEHRVNIITITNVLKRLGIPRRPRGGAAKSRSDEEELAVVALWKTGVSQSEIERQTGIDQTQVSRILKRRGVAPRGLPAAGARHGNWKGGRTKQQDGYVYVWLDPADPYASMAHSGGYVLEHRLVMARHLGRPLARYETVHHKDDSDRSDNRIENLQLRIGQHGKGAAYRCRACGSTDIEAVALAEER